ncbi:MAG: nucleotidyltransferase substrate binding protein [Enterovibrio sp.]
MLYLNVEHLRRCIETLAASVTLYHAAEPRSIEQEVFRNAIIKGYELAQETAFKLIKKGLKAFGHGGKKLETTPIKDILRLAVVHDLLTLEEVERWFSYRDNRNNTAHDYGAQFASETLVLLPAFLQDITKLAERLERKLGAGFDNA